MKTPQVGLPQAKVTSIYHPKNFGMLWQSGISSLKEVLQTCAMGVVQSSASHMHYHVEKVDW